jgi:hypothetical protein
MTTRTIELGESVYTVRLERDGTYTVSCNRRGGDHMTSWTMGILMSGEAVVRTIANRAGVPEERVREMLEGEV